MADSRSGAVNAACVGHVARIMWAAVILQRSALRLVVWLHCLLKLADQPFGNLAAVVATELCDERDPAVASSGRTRTGIGGKFGTVIRREDRGMDIGIAVAPEPDAIAPHRVVVDIVNGEWPEHRPDPAISAVGMLPPSIRSATIIPTSERGNRRDLLARRRIDNA
jgi:hypothetical protein